MFRRFYPHGAFVFWILWLLLLPASKSAQQSSAVATPTPLGSLVNVDGHLMHINCSGRGSPTVILEAGTGAFSFDWGLVQTSGSAGQCQGENSHANYFHILFTFSRR